MAVAMIGVGWMQPAFIVLGLIYAHPIIAFWILDREIGRGKPNWRAPYRYCLACLPVFLTLIWWRLARAPNVPTDDALAVCIASHAGAAVLPGVSSYLLVATHAFLEMLHYGVWVLAIPVIGLRVAPWKLGDVPLACRTSSWRAGMAAFLSGSAILVLSLWVCFAADYPLTRDVYFTVALVHVLAEAPFLLRAL